MPATARPSGATPSLFADGGPHRRDRRNPGPRPVDVPARSAADGAGRRGAHRRADAGGSGAAAQPAEQRRLRLAHRPDARRRARWRRGRQLPPRERAIPGPAWHGAGRALRRGRGHHALGGCFGIAGRHGRLCVRRQPRHGRLRARIDGRCARRADHVQPPIRGTHRQPGLSAGSQRARLLSRALRDRPAVPPAGRAHARSGTAHSRGAGHGHAGAHAGAAHAHGHPDAGGRGRRAAASGQRRRARAGPGTHGGGVGRRGLPDGAAHAQHARGPHARRAGMPGRLRCGGARGAARPARGLPRGRGAALFRQLRGEAL